MIAGARRARQYSDIARVCGPTYDAPRRQTRRVFRCFPLPGQIAMLTTLRKQTSSYVVKGLLFLLILSFAAWGIQDWLSPAISSTSVAKIGEREISVYAFRAQVNREVDRLRTMFGNQFDLEQAQQMGVVDAILNNEINRTLLIAGGDELGVTISDALVRNNIHSQDNFKGLTGQFDRNQFERFLQNTGMPEAAFIADTRDDLANVQFVGSLQAGVRAPKTMAEMVYRHRNERRVVEFVDIYDTDSGKVDDPDEGALAAFHQANAARFTAPEYRKVTLVRLEAADIAAEIAVSDATLAEAYEARLDEFTTLEKRIVQQMILADEETAGKAAKQLAEGRSFASVANDVADQDETAIDLGEVTESDLLPDLVPHVFGTGTTGVTEAVQSPLGWHIFNIIATTPGGTQSLDDVRESLRQTIAREKALDSIFDLSNQFEDELGGGATLEEAAARLNLQVVTVDAVDRQGRTPDGPAATGIPTAPAFLEAAFATEEGSESPLSESGPEGFFVLRVDAVTAPRLKALSEVRAAVIDDWKEDQRADASKKRAEALADRLNSGADLGALAQENGLSNKTSPEFKRNDNGTVSGLSRELVSRVFSLTAGKAATGRGSDGHQVAVLKSVVPADPGSDKDAVDNIAEELSRTMRNDIVAQLSNALRSEFEVSVNQALVREAISGAGGY